MKKLLLLSALFIFACSTDSEGNPCVYEPTLTTEAVTDITETSATLNVYVFKGSLKGYDKLSSLRFNFLKAILELI